MLYRGTTCTCILISDTAEKNKADDDLFEVSEEALLNTDFDDDADFEPEEEEYDADELDELAGVCFSLIMGMYSCLKCSQIILTPSVSHC